MRKILVTMETEERHRRYLEAQLSGKGDYELLWRPQGASDEELAEAEAIIGQVTPAELSKAKNLKWLQGAWAGADVFVRPGVLPEETVLTNASGAYGTAVSEHMVAMTFAIVRHLEGYVRNQVSHIWQSRGSYIEIEGSTVLVLGLGDIGGRYAKKMKALGANVIGVRRTEGPAADGVDEVYTIGHLDELLGRADIVAMALPGGPATAHLMDERRIRLMKKGAYLINDGRGGAIDTEALKRALLDGHLGGAALDVTEPEPLPENDTLWDMPNVIITAHSAGSYTVEANRERVVAIAGENLRRYVRGEALTHVVDRVHGY